MHILCMYTIFRAPEVHDDRPQYCLEIVVHRITDRGGCWGLLTLFDQVHRSRTATLGQSLKAFVRVVEEHPVVSILCSVGSSLHQALR